MALNVTYIIHSHSRTPTEHEKPVRSSNNTTADPNHFNKTLLQQQASAPIYPTVPERTFFNPNHSSDQDANVQQTSDLQQEPPRLQPPKLFSQKKKPEVIQAFGTKRQGVTQLKVLQASPVPELLGGWIIQLTFTLNHIKLTNI